MWTNEDGSKLFRDDNDKILGLDDDTAADLGLAPVMKKPLDIPAGQVATYNDLPHQEDGAWVLGYSVRDMTAEELRDALHAERERRLVAGAAFPVTGIAEPIPLQGRAFDQTVYLALLTRAQGYKAAGVTDPVVTVRDAANVNQSLTPDQMIELITQAMQWFETVMQVSWDMKDGAGDFPSGIPLDFDLDSHWPVA